MRTFMVILLVALLVAAGMSYAVGLVQMTTEQPDGQYIIHVTVNTGMLTGIPSTQSPESSQDSLDVKGRVAAVRPDKNELVVSENVKNWTFQLTGDSKIHLNDRDAKLSELQAGDDAQVAFTRQGQKLIADVVRCIRK